MQKKIVIVVSAMNLGGAQRVVSILCDHWCKRDFEVTLVSTFTGEAIQHYKVNSKVKLKNLSNSPYFENNNVVNLVWKLKQLRKIFKEQNPDLIISFLTRVNVATTISSIGLNNPVIISERTWTPFATLNKRFFWLYKVLFKRVDKIIVQTNKSKTWLKSYFPALHSFVIPNPVVYPLPKNDSPSSHPDLIISKQRKIILASGRLHHYKQFDLLIKSFSKVKDRFADWDLVILGDGEQKNNLSKLILEHNVKDRIFLPGSVSNIADWYQRADLFVLSSLVEGFPNVLLEAMTYGLPCISFNCDTGPSDMIEHGANGYLIDPIEKESGLINAMVELIDNEDLRRKFSKNSILLRDKYSPDNVMRQWDKILDI